MTFAFWEDLNAFKRSSGAGFRDFIAETRKILENYTKNNTQTFRAVFIGFSQNEESVRTAFFVSKNQIKKVDVTLKTDNNEKLSPKGHTKLVINTNLCRKVSDFRTKPHVVEKAFSLSADEFACLKNNLLRDNELISKNKDLMYIDDNEIRHCLLFYDNDNGDGILVDSSGYDYARYSQYIPGAKSLVESIENAEEITENTVDSEETETEEFGGISM